MPKQKTPPTSSRDTLRALIPVVRQNIASALKARHMAASTLATDANISRTTLYKLLAPAEAAGGEPEPVGGPDEAAANVQLSKLVAVADCLGVPPAYLLLGAAEWRRIIEAVLRLPAAIVDEDAAHVLDTPTRAVLESALGRLGAPLAAALAAVPETLSMVEDSPVKLAEWLAGARSIVVLVGAGMGTESGLQDFRSPDGLFRTDPAAEQLGTREALLTRYDECAAYYARRLAKERAAEPHTGHHVLARWQREGRLAAVITSAPDSLLTRAGVEDPIALAGELARIRCDRCEAPAPATTLAEGEPRECRACGGPLRPDVVLAGEPLPAAVYAAAEAACRQADVLLVLGSSLERGHLARLACLARWSGARLAIVNREPTRLDGLAHGVFRSSVRSALETVDQLWRRA